MRTAIVTRSMLRSPAGAAGTTESGRSVTRNERPQEGRYTGDDARHSGRTRARGRRRGASFVSGRPRLVLHCPRPTCREERDARAPHGSRGRAPPAVADAPRPVPEPDGDRHRQHDPQRRHPDAGASRRARADSAPRPASCSGSSTPTRSCSPACCSRRAASATASVVTARSPSASSSSASARCCRRSRRPPTVAHRHPRADGHRRVGDHAGDAVDPHQRVPRSRASAPRPSACGPACPRSASPSDPIVGGVLLQHFWWGSVFLVNVPGRDHRARRSATCSSPTRSDPHAGTARPPRRRSCRSRASPSCCGRSSRARATAGGSTSVLGGFVVGGAILAGFFVWELKCANPMLDVRFFENPRFSAASGAITLAFLALFGTIFLLTQYTQQVLGYSTVEAGAMLPPAVDRAHDLRPDVAPAGCSKFGNKAVVATGLFILAVALALMATFQTDSRGWLGHRDHRAQRTRHGARRGAGHRVDHGLAPARQGRCRLGDERHHAAGRRRGRGRAARIDPRLGVPAEGTRSPPRPGPGIPAPEGRGLAGQRARGRPRRAGGQAVRGTDRRRRPVQLRQRHARRRAGGGRDRRHRRDRRADLAPGPGAHAPRRRRPRRPRPRGRRRRQRARRAPRVPAVESAQSCPNRSTRWELTPSGSRFRATR